MEYLYEYLNIMVFLSNYSKTADVLVMFSIVGVISSIIIFTMFIKIIVVNYIFDKLIKKKELTTHQDKNIEDNGIEIKFQVIDEQKVWVHFIYTYDYCSGLSIYEYLFEKAKTYYPDLKKVDIAQSGVVNDVLPSLNGHAFISFISPYNEDLPKEATYLSSIVIFK